MDGAFLLRPKFCILFVHPYTGRKVSAGPGEATSIGNIAVQMLRDGMFEDLDAARACIRKSFGIRMYE